MDDSKIWRVNLSPRFTVLEMGDYMAADDGPRETMLRDARYERLARSLTYRNLRQAVQGFLASPTRDRRILAQCKVNLESEVAGATNPQQRENFTHELRALEAFERSLNSLELGGLTINLPARSAPLLIEGVKVSVQPTVDVRVVRPRGRDLVGAILVDVAKGTDPTTSESIARIKKGMTHAAVLIHEYVTGKHAANDDVKPSQGHCIVFHAHRQEPVCAPTAYRSLMHNVEAVCRNIARGWENIQPPQSFNAAFATFRN